MKKVLYSSDGAKIVFDVEGNGELLVLLHGAGGDRQIWEKCGWIEALKEYYTVVAVDIRGYGESDKSHLPDFYDIKKIVRDIELVVKEVGADGFSVFGHSYGATLALQCFKIGMKIKKMVLAGTAINSQFFQKAVPGLIVEYEKVQKEKEEGRLEENYSREDAKWLKKADLKNSIAQMKAWKDWENPEESDISCPVFLYSGTEDGPNILKWLREEKHDNPNIMIKIFDGLNHSALVSEKDVCFSFVLDFLQKK